MMFFDKKKKELDERIKLTDKLYATLQDRLASPIYTTIKTFKTTQELNGFWIWVKSLLQTDEYRFMIFSLRENVILEMVGVTDSVKIHELNARLNMLAIIDRFLQTGVEEHESEILRAKENQTGRSGLV